MTIRKRRPNPFPNLLQASKLSIAIAAASFGAHAQAATSESKDTKEGQGFSLEEVVVTARRRAESLQDTPLAVTALGSQQLEMRGVGLASDIGKYVPNVQFDSVASESGGGASSQIAIRGIGQTDYVITVEPGVAVYLDGVYVGKSMGSLLDTVDIEQIEVLRGPQGTLFGKNAIGGAVQLTSKRPTEEFEGGVEVTVGNFDRQDGKFFVSGPLSDTLRARLSLASQNRDGHVDRVSVFPNPQAGNKTGETQGDIDRLSGRLTLEWDVTENLMATLSADTSKIREQTPGQVLVHVNNDNPANLTALYNASTGIPACLDPNSLNPICYNQQYEFDIDDLKTAASGPNQSDADISGASLTLEWSFDHFEVKSITSYREVEIDVFQDLVLSPFNYGVIGQDIDWEQLTQEFQISGEAMDGKLTYVGGLFYSEEEGRQVFPVELRDFGFDSGGKIDNDSYAMFGQVVYDLTDQLSLTLGLRYTEETRRFNPGLQVLKNYSDPNAPTIPGYTNFLDGAFGPVGTRLFPEGWYERDSDDVTPMASLSYQATDDVMFYATYSEGYKGGGFVMRYFPAVTVPPGLTADDLVGYADPETATSIELGMKGEFFDSRLRLNVALFHVDYEDIQVTYNVDVPGSLPVPTLANAGEGTIQGLELEIVAIPTDWLQVDASLGYIDAEYDNFNDAALAEFPNAESFEFGNTPEITAHIGATVTFFDNETGQLYFRSDYSWKDDQYKEFSNHPELFQDSYGILDASLTYTTPDEKWLVSLGGTNLTDEIYVISGVGEDDRASVIASRPEEWYLRVKYNF